MMAGANSNQQHVAGVHLHPNLATPFGGRRRGWWRSRLVDFVGPVEADFRKKDPVLHAVPDKFPDVGPEKQTAGSRSDAFRLLFEIGAHMLADYHAAFGHVIEPVTVRDHDLARRRLAGLFDRKGDELSGPSGAVSVLELFEDFTAMSHSVFAILERRLAAGMLPTHVDRMPHQESGGNIVTA